jgi:flagellar hook-associated protein 2
MSSSINSSTGSSASIYISGLSSDLDTSGILTALKNVAEVPITLLENRKAAYEEEVSAWQTLNTKLLAFKTASFKLSYANAFSATTASSTNDSILTATGGTGAAVGDYNLTVQSVAKAHIVATQGYANQTDLVGSGTISVSVGSGAATSFQTDGLSLADLRDAINTANIGVRAYIVNTGSGATPYQLVLSSNTTGTAGQLTLDVQTSGGTTPAFSDLQTAANATIQMGTGLTITRSSNTITDLIPGVTINLHSANENQTVTLSVKNDTSSIKESIQDLLDKYNDLVDFCEEQNKANSSSTDDTADTTSVATKPLFGNYSLIQIRESLIDSLTNQVTGLTSTMSLLSQVGITLGTNGKLTMDETKFDAALQSNPTGVMKLFCRSGESSNASARFISGTADTQASGSAGYAIAITQAATHARVTSGIAQAAPLAADETLTINGKTIALTAGMTQSEVLAAINAKTSSTGIIAAATDSNGSGTGTYLTFTSVGYGANASVRIQSNQAAGAGGTGIGTLLMTEDSPLGEAGTGTGAAGLDVIGTINGEAATGSGQILTSSTGNAKGLQVLVSATAPGSYGSIVYTRGVAAAVDDKLAYLTEEANSPLNAAQSSLQGKIDDTTESISRMQASVDAQYAVWKARFDAMESMLSTLKSQQNYLTNQITSLNKSS